MDIKLYNTLHRKAEVFKPIEKNKVGIYVCGPTVYNYVHIGNLLSYVNWDILRRTLEYFGYDVKEVMNLTDVDDKTIRDSQKNGKRIKEFTEHYSKEFFKDIEKLNIEKVEVNPKATDHIDDMVSLIKKLLENKLAYKTEDGIYFDIGKFTHYGELSRLDKEGLKAGASGRIKKDEYDKGDVSDFVLWKFWDKQDGDVFWETSIGKGRPGWHIECSAMSKHYLGQPFDIHTGGIDLLFPHHENEIAQSEGAYGKKFVNYWLHNEHLLVNNEKMSKSKGNFYNLQNIVKKGYLPLDFRYLVISAHYRSKLNFSWESLEAASKAFGKLKKHVLDIKSSNGHILEKYKHSFMEALSDDLNTPVALSLIWKLLKSDNPDSDKYATIIDFDKVMGLGLEKLKNDKVPSEISKKLLAIDKARKEKNYDLADEFRSQIEREGYKVLNTEEGSRVEKV